MTGFFLCRCITERQRKSLAVRSPFSDIFSTKAKQFGFTMLLPNGVKFTCCGDEPYNEKDYEFVKGSDWLTHEAFCLYGEADKFKPYEKHHSTVKEACQLAEELQIPHLILYHTEEMHLKERKSFIRGKDGNTITGSCLCRMILRCLSFRLQDGRSAGK